MIAKVYWARFSRSFWLPPNSLIIGDGSEREAVLARAAALGIADRVVTPGWLGRRDIYERLIRADVCLGTSITPDTGELEGIPNVLKEAMAVGVPVAAARKLIEDEYSSDAQATAAEGIYRSLISGTDS